MYNIQCNREEPYAEAIATFVKQEFPVFVSPQDQALLDLLTDAILATGKVRLGPKPSPESQVAIRQIITYWTARNEPIPFLVAWGSEKPDGSGVDMAEVLAYKTLACLQHRVRLYYEPGVTINIRVEDASAPHLFFDRKEQARTDAAVYTSGFVNLAGVLGVADFINVRPESTMTTEEQFNAEADYILPAMANHVAFPENETYRAALLPFGWKTPLSNATIGFYLDRYEKLYPDKSPEDQRYILARYFAGALARHSLKITGVNPDWQGKFLELAFTAPTPGIGADRALRRVYYRTVPSNITSNHLPAWRGKGYLRINGEVSAALASYNSLPVGLNPNVITLSNGVVSQNVQADYVVI